MLLYERALKVIYRLPYESAVSALVNERLDDPASRKGPCIECTDNH